MSTWECWQHGVSTLVIDEPDELLASNSKRYAKLTNTVRGVKGEENHNLFGDPWKETLDARASGRLI